MSLLRRPLSGLVGGVDWRRPRVRTGTLLVAALALLLPAGCQQGPAEPEVLDLTVHLDPPGWGYQISTEPVRIEPWAEKFICSVVRIEPQADELLVWVDELESLSSDSSHHMNVFLGQFSFLDAFLEDGAFENQLGVGLGTYECSELGNIMEVTFPVFPSQRSNQKITMPPGVGIPLVAPLVLVMEHHYLNLRDQPALVNASLNIQRIEPAAVEDVASLIFDDIPDILVPADGQKIEARTCALNRDVELALVSTHNHGRGDCATLNRYSASPQSIEPDPFFVNKSWETPPILHFERGSFPVAAGDGIHWACHFSDQAGEDATNDGTAEGEMCVFAAVAYPAPRSLEEITETIESADLLSIYDLVDELLTDCDEHPEVESPWPMTESANFGEWTDSCAPWDQTESNVLD